MDKVTIDKIKRLMYENKYNQSTLAKKLEVSKASVNQWLKGGAMKEENQYKFIELFNLPEDFFESKNVNINSVIINGTMNQNVSNGNNNAQVINQENKVLHVKKDALSYELVDDFLKNGYKVVVEA